MAILQAIPVEWRRLYKNANEPLPTGTSEINKLFQAMRPLKYLQDRIQKARNIIPSDKINAWNKELGDDIEEQVWLGNFKNIYKTTISVKIRNFEYRYQIRDILTNIRLEKMKIKDSVTCTFCKTKPETLFHLYWDCYYTKRLWERLKEWLADIYDIPEENHARFYLMGITKENSYAPLFVYFITILTKMFIHRCKHTNILPCAQELKQYIKSTETLERNIATGKGRACLLKHLGKWTPFIEQDIGKQTIH